MSAPALLERRKKHQTRRVGPPAPLPRGEGELEDGLEEEHFNALRRRRSEALRPFHCNFFQLLSPPTSDLLSSLRPGNRGEVAKRKAFEWPAAHAPPPPPRRACQARAQLSYVVSRMSASLLTHTPSAFILGSLFCTLLSPPAPQSLGVLLYSLPPSAVLHLHLQIFAT